MFIGYTAEMTAPLDIVKFLKSETDPARLGPCLAEVAFVGRSNVGKSTLLNAVCRRDLARVSSKPGCTRTLNVFLAGKDRWLVDLPGYGFARGSEAEKASWSGMVEGYLKGRPSLKMVFALVDAKVGPSRLDVQMLGWLQASGLPWRVVATKADQVRKSQTDAQRASIAQQLNVAPEAIAWVSVKEFVGIKELRGEVASLLEG